MLSKIFIQNFALIDQLEVELHKGLLVITGETGAGKSIILGALRLMMGERADLKAIADAEKKSVVEGTFSLDEKKFKSFFEDNDLDFEKETIIRREITPAGKSRAFINDVPVTLNTLQELSERLIDIHSQFETSNLFSEAYRFDIIDGLVKNQKLLTEYQSEYKVFTQAKAKLLQLEKHLAEGNKEADYHQYLLQELEEARLDELNLDELKAELAAQENAETIIEQLSQTYQLLQQDEAGILTILNEAKIKLSRIAGYSENFNQLSERVQGLYFELKDIADSCENELEKVQINPEALAALNTRLNLVNTLLIKHQVQSVEELISIREDLSREQGLAENMEEHIKEQLQLIEQQKEKLKKLAAGLSEKRHSGAKVFVEKSQHILQRLGLEKAKMEVELKEDTDFNEYGKNTIQLLFQANSGFPLKPIHTAISGGERSRVMLAVKKIMAENSELPTLILDEIDTGVSGRVAEEIGKLMHEMGQDMQLIVITHLAQVAAKGDHNYKVKKSEVAGKTQSTIVPLSKEDKLQEIAQLLSGSKITDAAIEQAKELML
ncbi:DNA repair protein RecN [Elizabethkingia meningoseptica]|uniref:DNA repair protein RecN n=1 Tax=Elizabethkingia meningoseptica TaxID=238 RepID=UPI000332CF31|nr:DNA repair protein RecN [Elizabethkingia meningoseptica]AQX04493.1 DNA repair protein RecN [Elizabethkingia meningoseptica]AQX46534.1 DNA repair protein RecN [Elizabethkingia meningoseptica]EOR31506.1 DNA repair protein RecN [Elizabethkingia meningoseptica ATCC 13253 = NBRC 12535]KUY19049.1 DNA repair protein RecN [Elizabethkingia meningoseptica]OPB75010.1 DNA repair protein RecN [Elizabethkingia meningoseptica]